MRSQHRKEQRDQQSWSQITTLWERACVWAFKWKMKWSGPHGYNRTLWEYKHPFKVVIINICLFFCCHVNGHSCLCACSSTSGAFKEIYSCLVPCFLSFVSGCLLLLLGIPINLLSKPFWTIQGAARFFIASCFIKSSLGTVNTFLSTPPHAYRCAAYVAFPLHGTARLYSTHFWQQLRVLIS